MDLIQRCTRLRVSIPSIVSKRVHCLKKSRQPNSYIFLSRIPTAIFFHLVIASQQSHSWSVWKTQSVCGFHTDPMQTVWGYIWLITNHPTTHPDLSLLRLFKKGYFQEMRVNFISLLNVVFRNSSLNPKQAGYFRIWYSRRGGGRIPKPPPRYNFPIWRPMTMKFGDVILRQKLYQEIIKYLMT